jgi:hypothetical protein
MKRYSRSAIFSLVLGFIGVWLAFTRAGRGSGVTILFGIAACCTGAVAIWSIHQARPLLRGTAFALSGAFLGVIGTLVSFTIWLGMVLHQFDVQPRPGHFGSYRQDEEMPETNPMPDEPVTNFTSNLPIVTVDTGGQPVFESATVVRTAFYDTGKQRASLSAKPDYQGLATIHLRGTTTLHLPKKSYTVHMVDSKTNQIKVPLLGLPAEDDWVLYAPYEDKTMIRDVLAYELANQTGHYAPHTRYVELFVNTSSRPLAMRDYAGVYVLIEKIKRGKNRVNIAKLDPQNRNEPEIEGGYIVKRDHYDRRGASFHTQNGGPYFFVYPKGEAVNSQQKAWIRHYFNAFESALYSDDFRDRKAGYAAYLDVGAFIDAHWLIEMGRNVDGFRYSAFLTKDRGGKIVTGPPWDWNRSFGNANYYGGWQTQGWYWTHLRPNEISWFSRLREDPDFLRRSTQRWFELRKNVFDSKRISARIDELAAQLEEAQRRNFRRWPIIGRQVTCNYYVGHSYQDEVRWLKDWITRRSAWIDSQLDETSN